MNNSKRRTLPHILFLMTLTVLSLAGATLGQQAPEREIRLERFHKGAILAIAISPNGELLASTHNDATVQLWDTRDGRLVRSIAGPTGYISTVVFSPDGKILDGGSPDPTGKLWRVMCGNLLRLVQVLW